MRFLPIGAPQVSQEHPYDRSITLELCSWGQLGNGNCSLDTCHRPALPCFAGAAEGFLEAAAAPVHPPRAPAASAAAFPKPS